MRAWPVIALVSLAWLMAGDAFARGPASDNISRAMGGVVSVLPVPAAGTRPDPREPEGSGVVVLNGRYIATAAHVVRGAQSIRVRAADGRVVSAQLKGQDRATDIALLELDVSLTAIPVMSEPLTIAQRVCVAGNAFGLGVSVTCGVVSAVDVSQAGFNPIEDFVQTDASTNPGMSGGALLTESGQLAGMVSAIFTKTSDANIGVNFAVSVPLLMRVITELRDHGQVRRIMSGLILGNALSPRAVGRAGALVRQVRGASPAASAGFQTGDVLVAIKASGNGKAVRARAIRKAADFVSFTATLPRAYQAGVTVLRKGTEMTLNLKVGE